jgi:hypothetical protein
MNLELAKRAVACKRWRWMPGMLVIAEGYSSLRLAEEIIPFVWRGWPIQEADAVVLQSDCLPDFNDPATLGCLLALVREAQGDCTIWTMVDVDCDESAWICTGLEVGEIGSGYSEAHALVAALEAAP